MPPAKKAAKKAPAKKKTAAKKSKKKIKVQELTPKDLQVAVNNHFGPGTMLFGSDPSLKIRKLPSGVLAVDVLLRGGFARGRHVEVFGSSNIGKTSLLYSLISTTQAAGEECAFVDCEGRFDPEFAEHLGVDISRLAYHRQESGHQVIDFMEALLRSRQYAVIGLDSIASLLPNEELEAEAGASSMGMHQAKLMSKGLRKLTTANKDTVLFYVNQTRSNVGVAFGKKTITSGGRAMGFYAGTRLEMVRIETIKRMGRTVNKSTGEIQRKEIPKAHRILVRSEKESTGARPMDETTLVFDYDIGSFDPVEDLMFLGVDFEFIQKNKNTWFIQEYEDQKKVGRDNFRHWLSQNPEICNELKGWILEAAMTEDIWDEPDLDTSSSLD